MPRNWMAQILGGGRTARVVDQSDGSVLHDEDGPVEISLAGQAPAEPPPAEPATQTVLTAEEPEWARKLTGILEQMSAHMGRQAAPPADPTPEPEPEPEPAADPTPEASAPAPATSAAAQVLSASLIRQKTITPADRAAVERVAAACELASPEALAAFSGLMAARPGHRYAEERLSPSASPARAAAKGSPAAAAGATGAGNLTLLDPTAATEETPKDPTVARLVQVLGESDQGQDVLRRLRAEGKDPAAYVAALAGQAG